jgi:outer membrane protein insertion porin family
MKRFYTLLVTTGLLATPLLLGALPTIRDIHVEGNTRIPAETITHRLLYRKGGTFDENLSTKAIEAIYSLNAFDQVIIEKEGIDDAQIDLFITVHEKPILSEVTFSGNKKISTKKLEELIDVKNIQTITQEDGDILAHKIKKEYTDNDYHEAVVTAAVTPDPQNPQRASLHFAINEKVKSHIREINFTGNTVIPARTLRSYIQNREVWLLCFLDGAGKFNEAALEIDKERIRAAYANKGYFTARVTGTTVTRSDDQKNIDVLFTITEGPLFTIKEIDIAPDIEVPHRIVRKLLTLSPGDTYKLSEVQKMMESIKQLYGEYGFIDAYVSPQIVPDAATNTIALTFHVEKGTRWKLNRLFITGNETTRDHVIRRQLALEEGALITSTGLDFSKRNVEALSYFERESVTWKKHRLDTERLDLELQVKEVPTRTFNIGLDFGSSQDDPNSGVKGTMGGDLRNMFGKGWDMGFVLKGTKSGLSQASFHMSDPYLRHNLSGQLNFSFAQTRYDQWKWVLPAPEEKVFGVVGRLGTRLPTADRATSLHVESGVEHIENNAYDSKTNQPKLSIRGVSSREHPRLQTLLSQKLQAGTLHWVGLDLIKDTRNHMVYPNDGYKLVLSNKCALPGINQTFSFIKSTLHASWYTPLIGYDTLVLGLHAFGGIIEQIGRSESTRTKIPYRELFHLGGQHSIRGFNWGQVGPSWDYANPLGGKKAIQCNAELIFPLMGNNAMKIHLFYDTGCAWDTPKTDVIKDNVTHIKSDSFNMRHTIGIALSITQPQPIEISFGYKLDRNKKLGETPHEFHIGVNSAF